MISWGCGVGIRQDPSRGLSAKECLQRVLLSISQDEDMVEEQMGWKLECKREDPAQRRENAQQKKIWSETIPKFGLKRGANTDRTKKKTRYRGGGL